MASSAKDIQLRELKDTVSQLKTMMSEQTEMIRSLRLISLGHQAKGRHLISPDSSTFLMKLSRNRIFPDSMRRKRLL